MLQCEKQKGAALSHPFQCTPEPGRASKRLIDYFFLTSRDAEP